MPSARYLGTDSAGERATDAGLLVAWLIVSRVTRPLRILAAAAREVGQGRHPAPVHIDGASELQPLAGAFDRMSEGLQRNATAERAEVLAGISHDLRTPLARLRLECEMSISDDEARDRVVGDIEQMDAIIAQFLDYARGGSSRPPSRRTSNALLAHDYLAIRAHRPPPPISPRRDFRAARVRPNAALARAVANLLDNARKYGAAPFSVETRREGSLLVIDVADCGQGSPKPNWSVDALICRLENARTGCQRHRSRSGHRGSNRPPARRHLRTGPPGVVLAPPAHLPAADILMRGAKAQHRAGIHDPVRIERLLDRAHHADLDGTPVYPRQLAAARLADTMLGDRHAEPCHQIINEAVDLRLPRDECRIRRLVRHRLVVMQVAVADMTESDDPHAGKRRRQRRIGRVKELG